jgi:hypothetical protein
VLLIIRLACDRKLYHGLMFHKIILFIMYKHTIYHICSKTRLLDEGLVYVSDEMNYCTIAA